MPLPRVLVCTPYPFNTQTGGGITLRTLFEGWPPDRLALMYRSGLIPDLSISAHNCLLDPKVPMPSSRVLYQLMRAGYFAVGLADAWALGARLTHRTQKFVSDFGPDIIFTQLGSFPQISLARQLSHFAKVPLAVHIADDWANGFYRGKDPINRFLHHRLDQGFRRALELTSVRWGMSLPMAAAYEKRYGGKWGHIYNPIVVERWPERGQSRTQNGTFRLLYSGSIIGNVQKQSLLEICEAVARLGAEGMAIELNIYTWSNYLRQHADLARVPYVRLHEQVPFEQLPEHLGSADLLVLPVNFDEKSVEYIRYSMPGKVSEYLMSGTPILVYGPAEVVPVEYALREEWGHVVTEQGPEGVMRAIRELAANANRRETLARRAREVGVRNHDADTIRARVRVEISEGARQTVA